MEARLAAFSSEAAGEHTALRKYVDEQLQTVRSEAATTASTASAHDGTANSGAGVAALEQKMEAQLVAVRGQLGDIRLEASEAAEAAGGVQEYVDSALDDMKAWVTDQLAPTKPAHVVENGDSATDSGSIAKPAVQLQRLVAPLEDRLAALQAAMDAQKTEAEIHAADLWSGISRAADAAAGWGTESNKLAADTAALRTDVTEQVAGLREELLSMAASLAPAKGADAATEAGAGAAAAQQAELHARLEALNEGLEQLQRRQAAVEAAAVDAPAAQTGAVTDDQLVALKEELTGYVDAVADGIRAAHPAKHDETDAESRPAPGLTVAVAAPQSGVRHQAQELVRYADGWVAALVEALASFSEEAGPAAAAVSALYGQLDEALLGLAGELDAVQGSPDGEAADQAQVRL